MMEGLVDKESIDKVKKIADDVDRMAKSPEALDSYNPMGNSSRILVQTDSGIGMTIQDFAEQYPEDFQRWMKINSFLEDKMIEILEAIS